MSLLISAAVTVLALLLSGLLGTTESALASISRARVEQLVEDERPGARKLLRVLDRRAEHINILVLLGTVLDATAAVFAAALALGVIDSAGWALTTAILAVSLISFVVVGVFSRTVGRKNPYSVCLRTAVVLSAVHKILGPFSRLLIRLGNLLAPGRGFRDGPYATEVELREMVDIAQEHGIVEVEEHRMIQNVFDLAGTIARQIMVPRPEMIWIEDTKTAGQATSLCVRSGHSRIPVIGESIDEIVGVVYLKDLVARTYHMSDGGRSVLVRDVVRPAQFVPDSTPLDVLLHQMQRDQNHLAMLVDEYGVIAGMVSMEDILEEIVGEIADEYDAADDDPFERVDDRTFRVVAHMSLEELASGVRDATGERREFDDEITDEVDTVAGVITFELGRVPLPGSHVTVDGMKLTAEGGNDRRGRVRVRHVLVELLDVPEDATDPE
ncbi:membrane protein [Corynebacterium frankenforstense DSM 45800]|uniref:Membrane protein n=1 Tax=Corynebacterium frankenforstense DSM 45800 TaxID=1437875 RepID=A0A1L7CU11_9CORY|nr:hemolysin family protein [Corynebacterium frankenforstense]APT89311.1 membrane protein [Corynebacterium frankenforstense DSM 45800]